MSNFSVKADYTTTSNIIFMDIFLMFLHNKTFDVLWCVLWSSRSRMNFSSFLRKHISIRKYACNFYVLIFYCKTSSKCCKRVLHINIRTHTPHSTISFREWRCVSARKTCHHITSFHKKDGVTLQKKGWARPYLQSFFRLLNHREGEEEQELLVVL